MFAFSALVSFALAASAAAAPTKRAVTCQPSSFVLANVEKFSMTAFVADDQDNLVSSFPLTIGPATNSGGLDVLATVDSFSGATAGVFTMRNSAIATLASDGVTTVEWDNNITGNPSFLSFSPASQPASDAELYCDIVSTSAHGSNLPWAEFLELDETTGPFSLCETENGLNALIYGDTSLATSATGIITSTCFSVGIGISDL